jgi:hypothetical protein
MLRGSLLPRKGASRQRVKRRRGGAEGEVFPQGRRGAEGEEGEGCVANGVSQVGHA